jgi:hypothetical protein
MSIYNLVNDLCANLISENNENNIQLRDAKRIAFEILLRKSNNENSCQDKVLNDAEFAVFELNLRGRTKDADRLEENVELIKNDSSLMPILELMLILKDISLEKPREVLFFLFSNLMLPVVIFFI